jgi:predicted porin
MRRFGYIFLATVGLSALAQAADLSTSAPSQPAPAKTDCWSSVWSWLNASPADCPLGAYGVTLYGTLDVNVTHLTQGADLSPTADKLFYGIQKGANGPRTTFGYNGLSTSVVGLKMKEDILPYGWSLIGVLEAGVNPYSGMLVNSPRTLANNNLRPAGTYPWQSTTFDSSRAGQWDNSQGYLGISHPVYGTLTFGRTNSLALDAAYAYDPLNGSPAFSLIGFSSSIPGFGTTGTIRNTAVTYRLTYQNFRAAVQASVGGYDWDNSDTSQYQAQLGADFGPLSVDGVLSYAQNTASLSSYGLNPATSTSSSLKDIGGNWFIVQKDVDGVTRYYDSNDVLKATLSNNFGAQLVAKYKWNSVTFYGGYMYARLSNPSDAYAGGFSTVANGIFVPSGAVTSTAYLTSSGYATPAYPIDRINNTFWTGFKWSVWDNLDVAMGFYYQTQNDYNFTWNSKYGYATSAACTGTGAYISSSKCAGSQDAVSLLVDYKPVKRVDLYAGVMVSNVYGGMASGYTSTYYVLPGSTKYYWTTAHTQNWDPTIGLRIRF